MTGPAATGTAEVSVRLAATPDVVFGFFTDPVRYVRWMGSEAALDARPGGTYEVRMQDGFRAAGTFTDVAPPRRLVFTWGFADEEAASHTLNPAGPAVGGMPAGSTRVTVTLDPVDGGTLLILRHDRLPTAELVSGHQVAWETYLGRLAVVAAGGDPGPDPHDEPAESSRSPSA
jgi:uncharacterized protein YndB with AHSA1/START domain